MRTLSLWWRYSFLYELSKRKEKFLMWLAKSLPKELRMWVVIMAFADATIKNNKEPDRTGYSDVMVQFK